MVFMCRAMILVAQMNAVVVVVVVLACQSRVHNTA
jgi:hypothetical protein